MKNILSFILVLYMMIACLFNSFSKVSVDLICDDASDDIVLSDDEIALLTEIYKSETEWLASLQLENGAIPMTGNKNGEVSVNPYFSDFAALALLDDADKYADSVKKYLDWHFSHLNTSADDHNMVDGTIYDYTITLENGQIISESVTEKDGAESYDSTDSYAATFLTVLNKYLEKTNDTDYILSRSHDIERVVNAMFATFNFGLTYAKPDYKIVYLMDNCEVYDGMLSAISLFEIICDNDFSYNLTLTKCKYGAELVATSIEKKMWNPDEKHYESAISTNSKPAIEFSWDNFYPSATAQLFPIAYGIIDPGCPRAEYLYSSFCDKYDWEEFNIPDSFYWGANVYTAAKMGDTDRVISYMNNYYSLLDDHEYPLYNADAARVSMTAFMLLECAGS